MGWLNVQRAELGHDVFAEIGFPAFQDPLALPGRSAVSRNDDGELPRRLGQHFGIVEDTLCVSAVRAAAKEKNIGLRRVNIRDVVLGQFKGIHLIDLCAGAQAGLLGRLRRQLGHQAAGDHFQPSGRRRAGIAMHKLQRSGFLLQLGYRVAQSFVDVGLDSGIRSARSQQRLPVQIHRSHLGIGAAEINQ